MSFYDILRLSVRNLREAKLRATLTTMGVIVGVAVIVTMVSFGLGLQRNTIARFKALDLFNEIRVFGRSLSSLADAVSGRGQDGGGEEGRRQGGGPQPDKTPARVLDDKAVEEIAKIPGVAYVEPQVYFRVYMRSNGRVQTQVVSGANVPNAAARFQEFAAGQMIAAPDAFEAVVNEQWTLDFGYEKPADAIGKTVDFLAPAKKEEDEGEADNFFGIPLEDEEPLADDKDTADRLVARSFRIAGVLPKESKNNSSGGGFRGFGPRANVYIPLAAARSWSQEYRNPLNEVALELARQSGALEENQVEGYDQAVVRVSDPVALTDVRKILTERGFESFSIVDQLEQLRTVFLIINSALGLLGGISLLVASFGIANTMIMSILERTREIGIMKAIGAEDREIKLIFFVEAAVIGLLGGIIGVLAAWGIDALANRLAYRFILKPQGASYVDFFAIPIYLWLGAILFAVLVSILAALYPAARAARIDPVKALRHD
ncbi:MAG TPA: FtsX-like permease family protein [Pyrinomonadaceae bacterium]|jgi:putative ABC transport system permease protein